MTPKNKQGKLAPKNEPKYAPSQRVLYYQRQNQDILILEEYITAMLYSPQTQTYQYIFSNGDSRAESRCFTTATELINVVNSFK